MALIPPKQPITLEDLMEWSAAKEALARAKDLEGVLRRKCFAGLFPEPKEGTNTYVLPSQWQVKGVRVVTRDVDKAVLDTYRKPDPETSQTPLQLHSIPDDIVRWVPELNKRVYDTLTEEQRAFFDHALTIKDGSPQLSIVAPSKRGTTKEGTAA